VCHLQADCQEPGSAPKPVIEYEYLFYVSLLVLILVLLQLVLTTTLICFALTERPKTSAFCAENTPFLFDTVDSEVGVRPADPR